MVAGCTADKKNASAQEKTDKKNSASGGKKHINALAKETSPYLLLHAHNPVNWYAWNEESLKKARDEKKIIFLSIGYSSCHWCHVMERESFMDEEIAAILNEHFVCIKVDREERPDIDSIYMNALYIISRGRGGWPLSMFLTPDAKPFFGTTYMPARDGDRGNSPGFLSLLKQIINVWKDNRDAILSDADKVTRLLKQQLEADYANRTLTIDPQWRKDALDQLKNSFDAQYGGFGFSPVNPNRPKFPEPSNLEFLLSVCRDDPTNGQAREMLLVTLDRMAQGGIRDHIGGGFHRYSVDRFWRIPHFEKMLYDNGQLAAVYSGACELLQSPVGKDVKDAAERIREYRQVVEELLEFVTTELTSPEGGFYSALDAESEDEEGKYYRWTRDEIEKLIGAEPDYELFRNVYQIDREPNFESAYYAPQLVHPARVLAQERKMDLEEMDARLKPLRRILFDARSKRERPLLDTKILTAWNGLMIRGFADAGRVFKRPEYIDSAEKAARFVLANLRNGKRLFRTYSGGKSRLNGYLDDYAFFIDGLIALHRATGKQVWLDEALALQEAQIQWFWDEKGGGFFFTSSDHESLLARAKNPMDGARPSGISVSANNLGYLGRTLKRKDLLEKARLTVLSVANLLQRAPVSAPRMLIVVKELAEKE